MEIRKISELTFLMLYILPLVTGKKQHERKYCDYLKNVYYSEAVGGCKKCDPCFKGWGIVDEINFEIDVEKGALGCRICRPCNEGFFQKRYKAFKMCKACKVCKIPEQYETQKCTATQNRKCRKNLQDAEDNTHPLIKENRKQIPPDGYMISSTAISSQRQQTTTPETRVPMVPIPVPVKQALPIKSSPVPPKSQRSNNAVVDFKDNKEVFIVVAVFSVLTFSAIFGFIAKKTHNYLKKRHQQETALKEIIGNNHGQENTDECEETERNTETETYRKSTYLDTMATESLLQRRNKVEEPDALEVIKAETHEMCIHNRSDGMCPDSENSFPLLLSDFNYDLPPASEVSAFNQTNFIDSGIEDGIHMFSDKVTSISDVSDSERCDTPTSGIGSSDVTNDGISYCNDAEDDQDLTAAELQAVAQQLAPDFYKQVGRQLGVTDNEIRVIEANHPGNVVERAYEVLKKWTEKKAPDTTKKFLKSALIKVDRGDVVKQFYNNHTDTQNQ